MYASVITYIMIIILIIFKTYINEYFSHPITNIEVPLRINILIIIAIYFIYYSTIYINKALRNIDIYYILIIMLSVIFKIYILDICETNINN